MRARWAFSHASSEVAASFSARARAASRTAAARADRHDDDALLVAHDDVARPHVDAADPHRPAERAQHVLGPRDRG